MTNFIYDPRKVYGSEQLPDGYELVNTKKYAQTHDYSIKHVQRLCRSKRIKSYKHNGDWLIVVKLG